MPEARALRTFKGRYGTIRAGSLFQAEPGYLAQLVKNKLAEATGDEPGPSKDRNIPEAPQKKGKPGKEPGEKEAIAPDTEQTAGSGQGVTSASLQAGRASTKKTSKRSGAGGKGKAPPPKKKTSSTPPAV